MDIEMITGLADIVEMAETVMSENDLERRYRGLCRLMNGISNNSGGVMANCQTLIDENCTYDYDAYYNEFFRLPNLPFHINTQFMGIANDCVDFCAKWQSTIEHFETEGLYRADETERTDLYAVFNRDIYNNHIYPIYQNVKDTFEFRLCRAIQGCGVPAANIRDVYQAVSLFIALKNEKPDMEEERARVKRARAIKEVALRLMGEPKPEPTDTGNLQQENGAKKPADTKPDKGDMVAATLPSEREVTKRGRPSKPFKDYLQDNGKFQILRTVMNGKTGKEAVLVIKAAIQLGWITRPTYNAVKGEFGNIGSVSNYNKAMRENPFTDDEVVGMKNILLAK